MKKLPYSSIITTLLILLWVYAATSKLVDYDKSRSQILNQVFPVWISKILVWAVPATELIIAGLLLFPKTLKFGMYASLYLLTFFTLYIALIMTGIFGRIPCSCGGVLEDLSWSQHLIFNLFFLALTLIAIIYQSKVEPVTGNSKLVTQERRIMRKAD